MARSESVLDKIAASVRRRIAREKARTPVSELKARMAGARPPRDFAAALDGGEPRVIAEVKRASPSEGALGRDVDPVAVARAYAANGAAAVSVLTEPDFFLGSVEHLARVRREIELPLLMKDFFLEEYQLLQARAHGADCVLLIAALLADRELRALLRLADSLGLSALVEVHDEQEMERALAAGARMIGVNNRNLKTLRVDIAVSKRLAMLGSGAVLVCESGLSSRRQLEELAALGYRGFLIGTHFMKSPDPGAALAALLGREPVSRAVRKGSE